MNTQKEYLTPTEPEINALLICDIRAQSSVGRKGAMRSLL